MPEEINDRSILVKDFNLIKLNIRLRDTTRLLNAVRSVEMCLSAANTANDIVDYVVFCVNNRECSFFSFLLQRICMHFASQSQE